jgi:hypothetical protein
VHRSSAHEIQVGSVFNHLTVTGAATKPVQSISKYWFLPCRCACGKEKLIRFDAVIKGGTKSCGCKKPVIIARARTKHGGRRDGLYCVWIDMKDRCRNPNISNFHRYGGRGISVCEEWSRSYASFRWWSLFNGYCKGLQIDRINNDGNYEPGNCRWVSNKVNANNKVTSRFIEAFGERKTIAQWSEDPRCLVARFTLGQRIRHGWDPESSITKPPWSR